ncbi:hypothetical protein CDN99_23430 [Roseateles aquatilis]|uniref:Uncharacterized protein n=1 Tax=Roseateles aquatilis TaxID=431061 RepID=A0A246IWW1_9BURK|nr:hypothetical protein [Roseateles aquatilis]OWQ84691.1 hypothetical protein CDN99_23430 [Roseateles aquatilis]
MKTLFKTLLVLGLVLVIGAMVLGVSVIGLIGDAPGVHLTIDGDEVIWSGLGLADAFGAGLGLIITIGVLCLVLPLVLLLGLGLPLLILGGLLLAGIAALLGVGAVLGSPLILIGLIVWLLVRDKPRKQSSAPAAPAAGASSSTQTS